ncbi:uncharacterized protein B0H18DRAFT_1209154 [Fomitopsis serialis]|uniref:uncharacterized protein n=1 Tax=Fomitopsis serialis TaxID=139415 RepID=UPI002007988C|nr:uncharacterized protein B0H18DRAFT_1209154 [Neoantrodia serialis]KAH9930972.1 hypothetical protein B0H18DRAFT_1209154 [Neoantrodia serialis]
MECPNSGILDQDSALAIACMSRSETHAWAVAQLDDAFREVEEARRVLERSQRRRRDLYVILNSSAPVNRLPDELLIDIILHMKHHAHAHRLRFGRTWIRMTHVCHRWRATALNATTLWHPIYFNGQHIKGKLDTAQLCLQRSSPASVEVCIASRCFNEAMESLAAQEHRVAGVRVFDVSVRHDLPAIARGLVTMTNLESLALSTLFQRPTGDGTLHIPAMHAARLRKLNLQSVSLELAAPLANLTHLELSSYNPDYAAWICLIKGCPKLDLLWLKHPDEESCRIMNGGPRSAADLLAEGISNWEEAPAPRVMQDLRTLKLELHFDLVIFILQRRLLRIALCSQRSKDTGPLIMREVLDTFSSSPLTFLCIDAWMLLDDLLCLRVLRQFPGLEELRLSGSETIANMLDALCQPADPMTNSKPLVCKELKVLNLYATYSVLEALTAVLDAILSRNVQKALRLKELRLMGTNIHHLRSAAHLVERVKGLVDVFDVADADSWERFW